MPTSRYSGGLTIRLKYVDAANRYEAVVSAKGSGERPFKTSIGVPPASTLAVDSPEAFDHAAHAAISFAPSALSEYAAMNESGSGYLVKRSTTRFRKPTAGEAHAMNAAFSGLAADWRRLAPKRRK